MAAVSGHPASDDGASGEPPAFREAVDALRSARLRPEVVVSATPPPRRLAPYAFALTATIEADGEELADGQLVLLHEPDGHDAWHGEFRLVSLGRAQLEPEMAHDPLLPEVGWSWLMDSLAQQGARHVEPSGTVSRCSSQFFGGLAERPSTTDIEIRASWTPLVSAPADFAGHLRAWCELLCLCAGLPPHVQGGAMAATVQLPTRRHPR